MKFRTVALALALTFGLTCLAEAKKKTTYHSAPRKTREYKPYRAKRSKIKRAKFRSSKARKY
jgi:hypothetical protein